MSNFVFLALLIANLLTKSAETAFLGAPPSILEIVISVWVLGKWVEEWTECEKRGLNSYFKDWWNYNDLFQLLIFTTSFALRVVDYIQHRNDDTKIFLPEWNNFEPRAISVGFLACFYVMAFLRILGLTRTNRILGPLRITLAKMLGDVLQFFTIFSLVWFAFAIGLSELFWYYGNAQKTTTLQQNLTYSDCSPQLFTSLGTSLKNLFWILFGYFDPYQLQNCESNHRFLATVGTVLVGIFHLTMILILLNMLIAMMSKSFDVTSENKETEWRFYRAVIWIRFIKGDFTRPPPMNLLPNFYRVVVILKVFLQKVFSRESSLDSNEYSGQNATTSRNLESVTTDGRSSDNCSKLTNILVRRYRFHKYLRKQVNCHLKI